MSDYFNFLVRVTFDLVDWQLILFTFLFSRDHFHMGIWEKEVEVDWNVCTQIFQKCFLLTEIRQIQSINQSMSCFLSHLQSAVTFNTYCSFKQNCGENSGTSAPNLLFRENSHSSCAKDVQRCFLVFVFGDMLGCKAQQWINIVTCFLGRFSQLRDSCK